MYVVILTAVHPAWLKKSLKGPQRKIYMYIVTYTKGHSLELNQAVAFEEGRFGLNAKLF